MAGRPYDFTLGVRNAGDLATDGSPVMITDAFFRRAPSRRSNSAAGNGWMCTTAGLTVTCTRSDALAAGQSWPPVVVNATVADPAPATIINTADLSRGGDLDPSNDSATDAGGAVAQADLAH